MAEEEKNDFVLVCPKCGSTDIHLESGGFALTAPGQQISFCRKCNYRGSAFVEMHESELKSVKESVKEESSHHKMHPANISSKFQHSFSRSGLFLKAAWVIIGIACFLIGLMPLLGLQYLMPVGVILPLAPFDIGAFLFLTGFIMLSLFFGLFYKEKKAKKAQNN